MLGQSLHYGGIRALRRYGSTFSARSRNDSQGFRKRGQCGALASRYGTFPNGKQLTFLSKSFMRDICSIRENKRRKSSDVKIRFLKVHTKCQVSAWQSATLLPTSTTCSSSGGRAQIAQYKAIFQWWCHEQSFPRMRIPPQVENTKNSVPTTLATKYH